MIAIWNSIITRSPIAVAMLIILTLLPVSSATGQEANQAATDVADQPLDLAAMVLVPTDVDIPGIVIGTGWTLTVDQEIKSLAERTGLDPEDLKEGWLRRGWLRKYVTYLYAPVEVGMEEPVVGQRIGASIAEYRSTTAADVAFHNGFSLPDWTERSQVIGDESVDFGPDRVSTAGPGVTRSVAFRTDNLIGYMWVTDRESTPSDDMVESLAITFLERIEQVRREGGPSLSTRLVRPEVPGIDPYADNYFRLGNVSFPYYDYEEPMRIFSQTPYREASDAYLFSENLPVGADDMDYDPSYTSVLMRLPDEAAAAAWLANGSERVADFGVDWKVTPMPSAPTIGDESMTFLIEASARDGFLIYVRVGREIAQVHILAQPGTKLPLLRGLQELAVAQVACLRSQALCAPVPVPDALVPETGPATPAATSPAS